MLAEEKIIQRIDELLKKGDKAFTTRESNDISGIMTYKLNVGIFAEWRTQALNFLISFLGDNNNIYTQNFEEQVKQGDIESVEAGQGILRAVREDVSAGYLTDIRTIISAEVFTDFLEIVDYLLENHLKDPAASLCRAILEDGLRHIASKHIPEKDKILTKDRENLNSLNQECLKRGIYNKLIWRKIQVWIDIRNSADHGRFNEYSEQDVREMYEGVSKFLSEYLK